MFDIKDTKNSGWHTEKYTLLILINRKIILHPKINSNDMVAKISSIFVEKLKTSAVGYRTDTARIAIYCVS